jgi:hypothetical protein
MAYTCMQVPNSVFCDAGYVQGIDPIQNPGGVQNCSLIAALASVAWSTTSIINRPSAASYDCYFNKMDRR